MAMIVMLGMPMIEDIGIVGAGHQQHQHGQHPLPAASAPQRWSPSLRTSAAADAADDDG
jgi:hypothetical protein